MSDTKIAIFKGKEIRKAIHNNEWWFSVVDIVEVLTGTDRPRKYWSDLKKKLIVEGYSEVSEKIGQLKLESSDGKKYLTDCADTETLFRIIQSIPSPKVGGDIAGGARKNLEKRLKHSIVSKSNYLSKKRKIKQITIGSK